MNIDFKWIIGQKVSKVSFREPESWDFQFQDGGILSVECPWRILKDGHIAVSHDDHMQQFGLPKPVDAGHVASEMLTSDRIVDIQVREGTADLVISFDQNKQLQVLPFSSGYESWQVNDPYGNRVIAQGGGRLVILKK